MLIGKRGAATSVDLDRRGSDRITVRGHDLCRRIDGRDAVSPTISFCWRPAVMPTPDQSFFLDLALVALAEHGLTPSVQAARMTYAADPAALQGAVAAGVLGCGTIILGSARRSAAR